MSVLIKRYTRQLHRALAPIMLFPLLLTLTTGLLFHIAALNGKGVSEKMSGRREPVSGSDTLT